VQQAYLEVLRIFDRFLGHTEDELLAWLCQVVCNRARTERRYNHTPLRNVDAEVGGDGLNAVAAGWSAPSSVALRAEQVRLMDAALERLPETYRQVIVWRQWHGLRFAEIGQRLGRSPDAARMLWFRAVEQLGQELGTAP
jgi:RNA polymerase sigma-70 factor (ECF subfamily)